MLNQSTAAGNVNIICNIHKLRTCLDVGQIKPDIVIVHCNAKTTNSQLRCNIVWEKNLQLDSYNNLVGLRLGWILCI